MEQREHPMTREEKIWFISFVRTGNYSPEDLKKIAFDANTARLQDHSDDSIETIFRIVLDSRGK